jgi:CBS domain-containing protein
VWGIISDSDLVKAGIRGDEEATARDLALAPVISVKPTLPLREAGELMLGHQANHLAVVGETHQRPVGILSLLDIAGVLAWGEA